MPVLDEPRTKRWTRKEYNRMGDLGWFRGQRVELLEGEIVVLSPQNPLHFNTVERVRDLLTNRVGSGCHVRMQGPLDLGIHSEPEPDVAVVSGDNDDYLLEHPKTALLIVEVSDSTLTSDRVRKGSLYARAGIEDYWIVNLVDLQVEVYRDPVRDRAQIYGFRYATELTLSAHNSIKMLARPKVVVAAASLLPPKTVPRRRRL